MGFMGIGDWGLGIGDWANPQSPIPIITNLIYSFNKFILISIKKLKNYYI